MTPYTMPTEAEDREFERSGAPVTPPTQCDSKRCADCHRLLPLSNFYSRGVSRAGHTSYCKRCYGDRRNISREACKKVPAPTMRQPDPLNIAAAAWIRTS